jgi:hypothetical protein
MGTGSLGQARIRLPGARYVCLSRTYYSSYGHSVRRRCTYTLEVERITRRLVEPKDGDNGRGALANERRAHLAHALSLSQTCGLANCYPAVGPS